MNFKKFSMADIWRIHGGYGGYLADIFQICFHKEYQEINNVSIAHIAHQSRTNCALMQMILCVSNLQ